tara:strand:- start:136 stop:1995 length:1860 start_codon:yes stop_codon:yes gene_type:complete
MCGIFALLNNTRTFTKDYLKNTFAKGKNRGPETSEFKILDESTVFGFHRLAINGLDMNSSQPMTINGITLICNGEIYNYKQLFQQINVTPQTNSDCEIIIHLYEKYGIDYTLRVLDGVFAFAIYDIRSINDTAVIHIARDPFGVRPLYILNMNSETSKEEIDNNPYYTSDNIIAFASEIKSLAPLLNYKTNRMLSHEESLNYKTQHHLCLMEHSILREFQIQQFEPGTYSTYYQNYKWNKLPKNNIRYFSLNMFSDSLGGIYYNNSNSLDRKTVVPSSIYTRKIWTSLNEAVRKRVVGTCDVPIACLVSGGLDSSVIAALVNKYYGKRLETYSIGMPGSEDIINARKVAEHLQSKHTEIILSPEEFFEAIPEVIHAIESYDTTTVRASVGNYLIGKYIREHSDAKVIFNGDGSDELTGGYLYFLKAPDNFEFDKECRRLLKDIHSFDVLRSDKSISSNGLEPRTPFLDKNFVNTYLSIPIEERNPRCNDKNLPEKYLLRQSIQEMAPELLPNEILWRTKEAFSDGVSGNAGSWFQIISEKIDKNITLNTPNYNYKINPPQTKEQIYYREIFEKYYPNIANVIPYFWMPRFVNAKDSSARTLDIYDQENKQLNQIKLQKT